MIVISFGMPVLQPRGFPVGFSCGLGVLVLLTRLACQIHIGVKVFSKFWKRKLRHWQDVLLMRNHSTLPALLKIPGLQVVLFPFVLELRMNVAVRLAPQQWLPCGKAWLKLKNGDQFKPGDQLDGDQKVSVVSVQALYISISAAIK